MLKKSIFLIIALMVAGLALVQAQVPLPPLPNITLAMPSGPSYKVNVTSAQLRQLLEVRDQRYYVRYLFNSGYITEDEYRRRDLPLEQAEVDIIVPIAQADPVAYIWADGTVNDALKEIWGSKISSLGPGYPVALMNKIFGFIIPQPQGTRSSAQIPEYEHIVDIAFAFILKPYTDQIYNTIKQQLDTRFGTPEYINTGGSSPMHRYVLRSNRSGDGRPYLIEFKRHSVLDKPPDVVGITVWILARDP